MSSVNSAKLQSPLILLKPEFSKLYDYCCSCDSRASNCGKRMNLLCPLEGSSGPSSQ